MMSDGALSQDEMNALMSNSSVGGTNGETTNPFTDGQKEKIEASLANVVVEVGSVFGSMSSLDVKTSLKEVLVSNKEDLIESLSAELLDVTVNFSGEVSGGHHFIVNNEDALKFGSTLVGQPLSSLDGAALSAFSELFAEVSVRVSSKLTADMGKTLTLASPNAQVVNRGLSRIPSSYFIALVYEVAYEESNFVIYEIFDEFVVASLTGPEGAMPSPMAMPDYMVKEPRVERASESSGTIMSASSKNEIPNVKGVQLPNLTAGNAPAETRNISLLMDVMMELTVELGRTKWQIKNILSMGEGTIIELDKLAGEPVDILVNHNLIARGEVVIIDENFGVRVTEIISGMDKLTERR